LGKSLRIHSGTTTAIQNLRTGGQSLYEFLPLRLNEIVRILEMTTVIVRAFLSDIARATAQKTLWNVGRAVGSLGPITVGALAAKYSFHAAIGLLAAIYLLDIFATLFLIPELKGKPLL
jgi:hypothetical protein